jgi:hypothetical protein
VTDVCLEGAGGRLALEASVVTVGPRPREEKDSDEYEGSKVRQSEEVYLEKSKKLVATTLMSTRNGTIGMFERSSVA